MRRLNNMKVTFDGRYFLVEEATNKDVIFTNFAGAEKRDRNTGELRNRKGEHNFNLRVEGFEDVFADAGVDIKSYKFKDDPEDKPPIKFVYVNINTKSRKPPVVYLKKNNGRLEELPMESWGLLDGPFSEASFVINPWRNTKGRTSLYMNTAEAKISVDPIREKAEEQMANESVDPNGPNKDEGMPFD